MKNRITLALAAERWVTHSRRQIASARRTLAESAALVAESRTYFGRMTAAELAAHIGANAGAGVADRLRADGIEVEPVGDVTEAPAPPAPGDLVSRIADGMAADEDPERWDGLS